MKTLCIQQAYLDGWERCRMTIEKALIEKPNKDPDYLIRLYGMNPDNSELDAYQDGDYKNENSPIKRFWE